jgi:hypothetical protein
MYEWWTFIDFGKNDHLSLVTVHTLLHIGSGAIIGAVTTSDNLVLTLLLGWEVFEYWHAPAFGYWTVMNAGNSAMDIATGMWGYLLATGNTSAPWTYILVVPGALLALWVQCKPYETVSTEPYPRNACLEWVLKQRKRLYPWPLKGIKDLKLRPTLDSYMEPSRAHQLLAAVCTIAFICSLAGSPQVVPCLAAFTFGYAMGQPSEVHKMVYDDWYLAVKCELPADTTKCEESRCKVSRCDPGCCECKGNCKCKKPTDGATIETVPLITRGLWSLRF